MGFLEFAIYWFVLYLLVFPADERWLRR